eukprot:14668281-Alexandrium_andersonii.AAC.1
MPSDEGCTSVWSCTSAYHVFVCYTGCEGQVWREGGCVACCSGLLLVSSFAIGVASCSARSRAVATTCFAQ